MSGNDLILHEEQHTQITNLSKQLLEEANARFVAFIDRNGQPIGYSGELPGVDRTALSSLAAGNVAATEGLARMIGEDSFCSLYHEGESEHIYISKVGTVAILLVSFDERSSLGLVRLRVRQLGRQMEDVFDEMVARTREAQKDGPSLGLPEITDEDIESLFGDRF